MSTRRSGFTYSALRRRGFTLVELLVVIAIIGVLVALLLPAVQAAREAANRMSCSNNLKQLALACHNHEGAYKGFPPYATQPNPTDPTTFALAFQSRGWGVPLLPFLEQQPIYDQYDLTKYFYNSTAPCINQTLVNNHLPMMQCPSTPENPRLYTAGSSFAGMMGLPSTWTASASDYCPVLNTSVTFQGTAGIPSAQQSATAYLGAWKLNKVSKFAALTDGLSNTILFAEAAGRPQVYHGRKLAVSGFHASKTVNDLGTTASPWNDVKGSGWADASAGNFTISGTDKTGTVAGGSCAINCNNDLGMYGFHPGGAMIALADGSVRMFPDTTAPLIIVSAVSKSGGEVYTLP